ncbi:hypothetical protein LX15_003579 [Streptoalloteichus tenebrarius]|uniref:Uncharacterized protein n=1 Tax=Streptoalloteichus tenebrarius (strain ATCC 17920 / DSM 40477 / JCM 4838 / CBS 697.72 / NBRC 16177 / NCIMB 11028 / NRRL B-12390 / A12253. 1 / ISP 5477) TaxID=1933 RepID=A0ABT1HWI9_STRSD|nr:hypothetical protein [Streptoalloteichus tenebrarius]MCP2259870.1 hypothetical protein [Streptoalloteichus tenebrarius]BFE99180.1 hypothetical protein GCM10020241_08560 [Streptoalloteichus tenebrarius]
MVEEVHRAVTLPHRLLDQTGSQTHLFPNGDLSGGYRIRTFRDWGSGPDGQRLNVLELRNQAGFRQVEDS